MLDRPHWEVSIYFPVFQINFELENSIFEKLKDIKKRERDRERDWINIWERERIIHNSILNRKKLFISQR